MMLQQRRRIYYVPWLSLLSFIIVVAGTITCGVGVSNAIKGVNGIFDALQIDLNAEMNFAQKVAVFVIAGCCALAAGMLAMSCGRSCTEYAVDRRGEPTRGSAYWLGANAFVTVLWWLILVMLMFVFYICCLALGSMVAVTQSLKVVARTADSFIAAGIKYHNVTRAILTEQLGPLPNMAGDSCPANCLNLDILEYFMQQDVCICGADRLRAAYGFSQDAQQATAVVVAGAFVVWVGASFLLMNATADFAQGRRERALLMRLRRTQALGGSSGLVDQPPQQQAPQGEGQQGQGQGQKPGGAVAPAAPGIELAVAAVAAYGMPSAYGGGGGGGGGRYADVDKVPLLKDPQQLQPYQDSYQQQYEEQPYQQQPHQQQPYQQQPYQQQPYQQQQYQPTAEPPYRPGAEPVAVAAARVGTSADGGQPSFPKGGPPSRAQQ